MRSAAIPKVGRANELLLICALSALNSPSASCLIFWAWMMMGIGGCGLTM